MDMGVVLQVLPPTVEHGQKPDLGAQVLGIGGDPAEGCGRGAKQNMVVIEIIYAMRALYRPAPATDSS